MTTPISTDELPDATPAGELRYLALNELTAHPDNPRSSLGDLSEITRSIRSHGVLEPLVVLPADTDGRHPIVAGHRRHAAALAAGVNAVPVVVRAMTPVEVVEAMLSENTNRADLTIADEIRAIERLMSLEAGLTPAKLCRRIGKSKAWVRTRMAVTVLPSRWRDAIDRGELSLAAAEAATTVTDLGPEHLDAVCQLLARDRWNEPTRVVARYRESLAREAAYDTAVDRARRKHAHVYTAETELPRQARRLSELFDAEGRTAHAALDCHAVVVRKVTWGKGVDTDEVCLDPRQHRPGTQTAATSNLVSGSTRGASRDDSHAKRKGRVARLTQAHDTFAKSRGGPGQSTLTRLALTALVYEAGREALTYAATILGHDEPRDVTVAQLLVGTEAPAALARVAAAVACGLAETSMYWSASSDRCQAYLALLCGDGWEPDDWTRAVITATADDADRADESDADAAPCCDPPADDAADPAIA